MLFLLDSDSLSDFYEPLSPGHSNITRRIASFGKANDIVVSILSIYELEYGYANADEEMKPAIRRRISDAQNQFSLLPLTPEAARLFGTLKARLRILRQLSDKASKRHNMDVMVAATAITEGCTLISADGIYSDLRRIDPTLRVENWLAST
ncbi:MAG TPA: type II toxin-antitoxin system VapC family toxin [Thermoanaerobaculia bacterium]|nr:type II toxin-antitoxin system VapC family toxin [Thermoanaerobaculia bacterium]